MFKKTLFFVLVCLSLSTFGQEFQKQSFTSKEGFTLNYRILFPENYEASKAYPVLLFLHGAGERGDDNEKQLTHGKAYLEAASEKVNAIIVAPQCPKDSYWSTVEVDRSHYPIALDFDYKRPNRPPMQAAIELVQKMVKEGKAQADKLYIMGLSMGGMGTLESIYRFPKMFQAAIAICGAADLKAYAKKSPKIPIWLFHGDSDSVVGVENSRQLKALLKSKDREVFYTEFPGVNHNSWDNVFAVPLTLDWLLGH
ncbi:prolyl oligopeptidase family serine peptidase [Marinilongibacter aquaticus]|uniref:carboxylesterase family protein n=1 Tax=Marinilongibacter aquaticus TaxID=2975157 RepID=UPI0021BD72D2|nr:prolyl oligopeptidase family serine peptidase [Marinilongibacter aquaticus]UBM60440.1 prolyl oligopeptidase family serine peptidase [Marinilongibacter aquaticus]